MKVTLINSNLLIIPETDFEREYMKSISLKEVTLEHDQELGFNGLYHGIKIIVGTVEGGNTKKGGK